MTEIRSGLPIHMFADAAAFEVWLGVQEASAKGAWLRMAKKGTSLTSLSKAEVIDAALCHGWIDGQLDKYDDETWLIRFTPRGGRSKWSEVNRTRAEELIAAGRMRSRGLAEVERAKADGRWAAAYAPASKAAVPDDLAEALAANPAAKAIFETLTGANRYAVLYRIGAVKRPETRARKIADYVAKLARSETIHG